MKTQVISVKSVSRTSGVCVVIDGQEQWITFASLQAAAKQDDMELAATYTSVLDDAKRMAALEKHITIRIVNDTYTTHGHEARMYDMAGEYVSGRLVGVWFGEAGTHAQAMQQAAEAKEKLGKRGYSVEINAR